MRILIFIISAFIFGISCKNDSVPIMSWKRPEVDSSGINTSTIGFKYHLLWKDTFNTVDFYFLDTNNIWRLRKVQGVYYADHFTENFKKCESQRIGITSKLGVNGGFVLMPSSRTLLIITEKEIWYSLNYSNEWHSFDLKSQIHETVSNIRPARSKKSELVYLTVNDTNLILIDGKLKIEKLVLPGSHLDFPELTMKDDTILVNPGDNEIFYSFNKGKLWDTISTDRHYNFDEPGWNANPSVFLKDGRILFAELGIDDTLLYSDNFGKSWQGRKLLSNNESGLIEYDLGEFLVFKDHGNKIFYYSNNGGKDWYRASGNKIFKNENNFFRGYKNNIFFLANDYQNSGFRSMLYQLDAKGYNAFKKVIRYKTEDFQDSIRIDIEFNGIDADTTVYELQVYGANTYNFNRTGGQEFLLDTTIARSKIFSFRFPVNKINANQYNPYKLKFVLTDNLMDNVYILGPIAYNPTNFFKEHPTFTIILTIIFGYSILLSAILLIKPYWIFLIHFRFQAIHTLEEGLGKYGLVFKLLRQLTFIPLFVSHKKTLDAWIEKHGASLKIHFERQATVQSKNIYIPLPVKIEEEGKTIEKPSPDTLSRFFKRKVVCIQIVGVGGIGKTTFVVQIGRWLASAENKKYFAGHRWVPFIVEQDTTDIISVLVRHISSITGRIDEGFLKLLLRKKRLVLIFDSLSEREEATREYIASICGDAPIHAMLITSRRKLNIATNEDVTLYPLELAPDKLLYFISNALQAYQIDVLKSAKNQIQLANRIAAIFIRKNLEMPVIPILIHLVIKQIDELAKAKNYKEDIEKLLATIPNSIPEIFFEYLHRVNPVDKASNAMKHEGMRLAAETIAQMSLGDNFIPQDIQRQKVEQALKEKGLLTEKTDPVKRLIDNGILETRKYGGKVFLRFSLDPLSEYLAAMRYAEENDKDVHKWKQLYAAIKEKGEHARGFLDALELVHETYWEKFKWYPPVE